MRIFVTKYEKFCLKRKEFSFLSSSRLYYSFILSDIESIQFDVCTWFIYFHSRFNDSIKSNYVDKFFLF